MSEPGTGVPLAGVDAALLPCSLMLLLLPRSTAADWWCRRRRCCLQDKHGTAVRKDTILPGPLQGAATLPIKLAADVLRWTGYQRRRRVWGRESETAYSRTTFSPQWQRDEKHRVGEQERRPLARVESEITRAHTLIVCHPVSHILLDIIHVNYKLLSYTTHVLDNKEFLKCLIL